MTQYGCIEEGMNMSYCTISTKCSAIVTCDGPEQFVQLFRKKKSCDTCQIVFFGTTRKCQPEVLLSRVLQFDAPKGWGGSIYVRKRVLWPRSGIFW